MGFGRRFEFRFDQDGNYETSLILYLLLAERGYEMGQSNAAFILDMHNVTFLSQNGSYQRAFVNWRQSAVQGSTEAYVRLGDYHYAGLGTPQNYQAASQEYLAAVEGRHARAMFNLGFMHQFGIGLPRDFHLAKRYYDQALASSTDAVLPVGLALFSLQAMQFWETAPYKEYVASANAWIDGYLDELDINISTDLTWEDVTLDNALAVVDVSKWLMFALFIHNPQQHETALITSLLCLLVVVVLARRLG